MGAVRVLFFNLATGYKGMFILWQHMETHTYNF